MAVLLWSCLLLGVTAVILLVRYLKRRQSYFLQMGIPGPKPQSLILGNLLEFKDKIMHEVIGKWTREFGSVFGYYEGGTPIMMISDLDMIQEILVKKFSQFHARKLFPVQADPDHDDKISMFTARGSRWKRLRSITNPTFSAAKMKLMTPLMNQALEIFVSLLDQKADEGKPFDVYQLYQSLTMDVIGRTAFGVESNCQRDPKDKLLTLSRKLMNSVSEMPWIILGPFAFPEIRRFWFMFIRAIRTYSGSDFYGDLQKIVEANVERWKRTKDESTSSTKTNLITLLLDAELTSLGEVSSKDAKDTKSIGESQQKKLTAGEVVEQSILFFIAGFETTSTALAYVTYLLATNPDVQQRLQKELDNFYADKNEAKLSKDNINQLEYLDMVIHESLRMYPIATPVQARICMESCTVGNYHIPSGLTVAFDVWTIHHDPQIYPDPSKFDPERFTAEQSANRHPMAWIPFGAGPRNCIGMRFALMELKLTLAKVLSSFSFEVCEKTKVPLKLKEGASTTPESDVTITVSRRHKTV